LSKKNLDKVKAGDEMLITCSEVLAISVMLAVPA
jgi:hypothetical protein